MSEGTLLQRPLKGVIARYLMMARKVAITVICSVALGALAAQPSDSPDKSGQGVQTASRSAAPTLFRIDVDGKAGFVDKSGKVRIKPRFDKTSDFAEGLAAVRIGLLWGYINTAGKVVIEPQYDWADGFWDGFACVTLPPPKGRPTEQGRNGYVDRRGRLIGDIEFDHLKPYRCGVAPVRIDGKWGCIDKMGTMVVAPQYDEMSPFEASPPHGALARVVVTRRVVAMMLWGGPEGGVRDYERNLTFYGFIDTTGKTVIKLRLAEVTERFQEGLAPAKQWQWGPPQRRCRWRVGRSFIQSDWGYIDEAGRWVIKPGFKQAAHFWEGLAAVADKDKWGYIDKSGKMVIAAKYDVAGPFREGLARVNVDGKWGYIDKVGKVIVKPHLTWARDFQEGLAAVGTGEGNDFRAGFLGRNGKIAIPLVFDSAGSFLGGVAKVRLRKRDAYIDRTGKIIWQKGR